MILKVVKFFIKLVIGLAVGIILAVVILTSVGKSAVSYVKEANLGYRDASKIVWTHQAVENTPVGETCICAICMKEKNNTLGAEYVKKHEGMNSCCPEHEHEYQEIYRNWVEGVKNKENLEKQGIRFK